MKKNMCILWVFAICVFLSTCAANVSAQPTPKKGGILKIATRNNPVNFGVPKNLRGFGGQVALAALDTVVQRSETMGVYEGQMAESLVLAPDKSSYTFYLRKGIKFHDGTPFNAKAVKWNWDKILAEKETRGLFKKVSSFEVLDDYTIRANLSSWNAIIMEEFVEESAYVISPTTYEEKGEKWCNQHPVGAGPWIFEKYVRGQKYTFKRNPEYWNDPYPYMDGLEYHSIADPMTSQALYVQGEVDWLNETDLVGAQQLMEKGFKPMPFVVGGIYGLAFNSTDPNSAWSDIRMRQALEYAIDKETIATAIGKGFMSPAYEILRGAHKTGDPGTTPRTYNPEKAKALMAEAGYPDGIKVKMKAFERFYGDHCVAIQHELGKVGIDIEIDVVPGPMWEEIRFTAPVGSELRWDRGRGMAGNGLIVYGDSDYATTSINYPGMKRPVGFDEVLNNAMNEADIAKREPLMMLMEKMMYENSFSVPYFNVWDVGFRSPDLKWDPNVRKDVFFTAGSHQQHYEFVWREK